MIIYKVELVDMMGYANNEKYFFKLVPARKYLTELRNERKKLHGENYIKESERENPVLMNRKDDVYSMSIGFMYQCMEEIEEWDEAEEIIIIKKIKVN